MLAIGELATPAGVRALLSWLEALEADVRAALARAGAALVAPTIELWPTLGTYHRAVLAETVTRTDARSEELFALLVAWLADSDDRIEAVCALADYRDPRAVPHLLAVLDQALADGDDATTREIDYALRHDFATEPPPEQRARIAALPPRRFAPAIVESVPDAEVYVAKLPD